MEIMQKDIEIYRKIYEDAGMVTIPLAKNSKIPIKGLPLNDIYDGHNVNGNYEFQNIGIVTGRSRIVVFDCDTQESIKFFTGIKSYIETAKVKSRRGMHFYYRISNENIHPQRFSKGNIAIDLKAGRSYVVAPPSIVDGHIYTWDPDDWTWAPPITELSEQEFFAIIEELKEFCFKNEQNIENTEKNKKAKGIDIEKIIEIIKPYYISGQRQDIVMAIAGIMKKAGIPMEDVIEIVAEIYNRTSDEDPISQRISAVINTYKKNDIEIAGFSILERLLSEDDFQRIADIFQNGNDDMVVDNHVYVLRDKYWWHKITEEKKIKYEMVCKGYKIKKKYETENQKVAYVIETMDGLNKKMEEYDMKYLEKILGEPVLMDKHAKRIFIGLSKIAPMVRKYERLGWIDEKTFLHPYIPIPNIEVEIKNNIFNFKDFIPFNPVKQHQFVHEVLREGKLLAVKMVFAVASLFTAFTVIDIAPRWIGKTQTSKIAIQLFYRCRNPLTALATKVAMELILASMKNMPILFDEGSITFDEKIESLVFMLFTKKGTARGTKELRVKLYDLESVCFITSEKEIDFSRLGAFRRFIGLNVSSFSEYTELFSVEDTEKYIQSFYGCGVDYILHYTSCNRIIPDNFLQKYSKMGEIPNGVEKAIALLEDYYQERFDKTRKSIIQVFESQNSEVEKDTFEIFMDILESWIAQKINHFITLSIEIPKTDIYGIIEHTEEKKVWIIAKIFEKFCSENGFSVKYILKQAKERKILVTKDHNRFATPKKFPVIGTVQSCYCFILSNKNE